MSVTLVHGRLNVGVVVGAHPHQVHRDDDGDGEAGTEGEGRAALAGQENRLGRPRGLARRGRGGEDSPRPDIEPG